MTWASALRSDLIDRNTKRERFRCANDATELPSVNAIRHTHDDRSGCWREPGMRCSQARKPNRAYEVRSIHCPIRLSALPFITLHPRLLEWFAITAATSASTKPLFSWELRNNDPDWQHGRGAVTESAPVVKVSLFQWNTAGRLNSLVPIY